MKVTSFAPFGENTAEPDALNDCPAVIIAPPLSVERPVTVSLPSTARSLLIVVEPA